MKTPKACPIKYADLGLDRKYEGDPMKQPVDEKKLSQEVARRLLTE